MSISLLIAEWLEDTLESKGSRVRFPAEAYIIILKFSLTERCSHPGEDHTNEIKHDIHPEYCVDRDLILKQIWWRLL